MNLLLRSTIRSVRSLLIQPQNIYNNNLEITSNKFPFFKIERTFTDFNNPRPPDPCASKESKDKEKTTTSDKNDIYSTDPCKPKDQKEAKPKEKAQKPDKYASDPCKPAENKKVSAEKASKAREASEKKKAIAEKKRADNLKRFKYWQARFQCPDGLPVFLKLGMRDKILYYLTIILCFAGITGSVHTFLTLP